MDMRLKETFTKRHVCSWRLNNKKLHPEGWVIERTCPDCAKVQSGLVSHELLAALPPSLVHLADVPWKDGTMATEFASFDLVGPGWFGP